MNSWICVGRLLRPQGRRGEILTEPMTDLPEIFVPGRELWLGTSSSTEPTVSASRTLLESWEPQGRNAGRLVVKLNGVDSISEAEALAGTNLFLRETELPTLAADTFLVRDLVGCALWDGEVLVGTVEGLELPVGPDGRTRLADAPDLLVVNPVELSSQPTESETETVLVPFVQAWLLEVNTAEKRIRMRLPAGLFPGVAATEPTAK